MFISALVTYVQAVCDAGVPALLLLTLRMLFVSACSALARCGRLLHALRTAACIFVLVLAVTLLAPKVEGRQLDAMSIARLDTRINGRAGHRAKNTLRGRSI